jgi:hypothetical protein
LKLSSPQTPNTLKKIHLFDLQSFPHTTATMAHTKEKKDKSQKKDKVEKKEHKSEKAQKASALAAAEKLDPTISSLFANSVCAAAKLHLKSRKLMTALVRCCQTHLYRDPNSFR